MFEAIQHPVLKLVRIRIGTLGLGDLPVGKYKLLSQQEAYSLLRVQRTVLGQLAAVK
jgi:16S rRNA U516 pseudouridylate synthase RsuA-like enzyme